MINCHSKNAQFKLAQWRVEFSHLFISIQECLFTTTNYYIENVKYLVAIPLTHGIFLGP
jgi:hypothetical protein